MALRAVLALLVLLLAPGCATSGAPAAPDSVAPPLDVAVSIPGPDASLRGTMHVAGGAGPHPTVLLLHGLPGSAQAAPDAIRVFRESGLNVLYVNYRGTWGSEGSFSIPGAVADAGSALAFVRAPESRAAYRADGRVALLGHSFGGWVALNAAAADPAVPCVATAAVFNLGALGRRMGADEAYRARWTQILAQMTGPGAPVRSDAGDGMAAGLIANAEALDLARLAPALRGRAVLMLGAGQDQTAPFDAHGVPVVEALATAGAARATSRMFAGDHDVPLATFAPAVAEWVRAECTP